MTKIELFRFYFASTFLIKENNSNPEEGRANKLKGKLKHKKK